MPMLMFVLCTDGVALDGGVDDGVLAQRDDGGARVMNGM